MPRSIGSFARSRTSDRSSPPQGDLDLAARRVVHGRVGLLFALASLRLRRPQQCSGQEGREHGHEVEHGPTGARMHRGRPLGRLVPKGDRRSVSSTEQPLDGKSPASRMGWPRRNESESSSELQTCAPAPLERSENHATLFTGAIADICLQVAMLHARARCRDFVASARRQNLRARGLPPAALACVPVMFENSIDAFQAARRG
jgi:hypothetical protein